MAEINPGLAASLRTAMELVHARELTADDNTVEGHAGKGIICGYALTLVDFLERPDGSNALDYEDTDRTAIETFYKGQVVRWLRSVLDLLQAAPERSWDEIASIEQALAALQTLEDTSWPSEIVEFGAACGITVGVAQTTSGTASFSTAGGVVSAHVYKARTPDVALEGVTVYLLEELPAQGVDTPTGRFAVMVDDPYWGRRIQGAAFVAAPFEADVVMGYRLKGRVLESGTAVDDGNVSLQIELQTADDGSVVLWDSLEYNELVYDSQLETYVAGAVVRSPIRTGQDGRWEFIAPKGHGAIYQRAQDLRDDTAETAARGLARCVQRVECAYRGRTVEVVEGVEAVLDILSGSLAITAEPGAELLVGALDNPGQLYTVPSGGVVTIDDLPQAEHSIVAFKLTPWGAWDQTWGCPRALAQVTRGATTQITMSAMEHYTDLDVICGRVYERPGVPAVGVSIVAIDMETLEVAGTLATTDGGGFWTVTIPPEGLGGEPCIHDVNWGSVPVLGMPYSDIVLGARAYSAHYENYKPEAWRCRERGHKNFQFCPDTVVIRDPGGSSLSTVPTDYGGWVTTATLPKHEYVDDVEDLVFYGPQTRQYDLLVDGEVAIADIELRSQPFEGSDTAAGNLRAAGFYPEIKFFVGGKAHGAVVKGQREPIKANLPEAARVGLEFGEHDPCVEVRALGAGREARSCVGDLVCPYCGGPAHRDPSGAFLRGFCIQCAVAFNRADAMDCRGYFETPTLATTGSDGYRLRLTQLWDGAGTWSREVRNHWRPDLYEETDDFLTQSGPGQPTNAPRWVARHVDELDDSQGFGTFDGDEGTSFAAGHDITYYEGLPEVLHEFEATQLKLAFAPGYVNPATYTVAIDCKRADGSTETRNVTVPAGLAGPGSGDEFGDVVPVVEIEKLLAEGAASPYAGTGHYVAVTDVRLVEPATAPGCAFTIVNDGPVLASAAGVPIDGGAATPVALQVTGVWGRPHVLDDAVGQLFMFWVANGDVFMSRRPGLPGSWSAPRRVTEGNDADEPWAAKDASGRMVLMCRRGADRTEIITSCDDGARWEEAE